MPRIYCDLDSGELFTEAEVRKAETEIIEQYPQYVIDELENYTYDYLWRMLTDEAKVEVTKNAINRKIENEYGWRDFTDKELE